MGIAEVIEAARTQLSAPMWQYAAEGTGTSITTRRNRAALESIALRSRVLAQTAEPDLSTTVMGQRVKFPVVLAPVAWGMVDSLAALAPARAAHARGTFPFIGTLSWPPLEEVAAQSGKPLMFQIYVRGDRSWLKDIVQRAEESGYVGFCLTADSSGNAKRITDMGARLRVTGQPRPNIPESPDQGSSHQVAFSWDDFAWLRSLTKLPIALKGVLDGDDARLAVSNGANAVYVSNHGGRELDHLPGTIEVLPEIIDAVGGQAEVLIDGGFEHGPDVVKALAMGARAVAIGKLQLWALAAGGLGCLIDTLEALEDEIAHTLRLIGVPSVAQLGQHNIRPAIPV